MKLKVLESWCDLNTLRPNQNGRHFADDIFEGIFLYGNVYIVIKISLLFVPKGPIDNISASVQIMAWCHPYKRHSAYMSYMLVRYHDVPKSRHGDMKLVRMR